MSGQFRSHVRSHAAAAVLLVAAVQLALFVLPVFVVSVRADDEGNRRVKAQLVSDRESFQPSKDGRQSARIGVLFHIEPGWHIYWQNSGEAAIPTSVSFRMPAGWSVGTLRWPAPLKFLEGGDITTFGYRNEVLLIADLTAPASEPVGQERVEISAQLNWLVCKDICVPGRRTVTKTFFYSETEPLAPSVHWPLFEKYEAQTPQIPELRAGRPALGGAIQSVLPARPGESLTVAFPLIGAALPAKELAKELQIFPAENSKLRAVHASITESERGPMILIPVTVGKRAEQNERLSGIIVFSKELVGAKCDLSVPWSTDVSISTGSQAAPNAAFSELNIGAAEQTALSFRLKQPGEHARAAGQTTAAEFSWPALATALISAFLAGVLLNLMPCVLPILSIKALSFVEQSTKSRSEGSLAALFFALGIIASLLVLALLIIFLKAYGMEFGWGFQFQYPGFVYGLLIIVFLLSLGLFDLYRVSIPFVGSAGRAVDDVAHPWIKSFFEGVLTTALATPCTAPFLGTALAFAFTQSWQITLLIFFAIGSGLSLPYLAIASSPRALALIPRPGPWMPVFKELMAFLLLGTAVWLLFILDRQLQNGALLGILGAFWTFFCVWLYRVRIQRTKGSVATLVLIVVWALCISVMWPKEKNSLAYLAQRGAEEALIDWQHFSPEILEGEEGKVIFIDFTADWCITCKANERLVLNTVAVAEAFKRYGVTAVRADWTNGDAEVTRAMRRFNANGVPLYVVIKDGESTVLPSLLTKSLVLQSITP